MGGGGSFNGMEAQLIRKAIETSDSPEMAGARLDEIARIGQSGFVDKKSLSITEAGAITFETLKPTSNRPGVNQSKFVIPKDVTSLKDLKNNNRLKQQ